MNFEEIKKNVLFHDGSLRDVLIQNTSRESYRELCVLLGHEKIPYEIEIDGIATDIETAIAEFDKGHERRLPLIRFFLNDICFVAHLFSEQEIEIDFVPNDVKSAEAWLRIVDVLSKMGSYFQQRIFIYEENVREEPLFKI
jgi:hypothetical protein